ncbi:MAG: hypothetical protein K6347_02605 [Campylobacterales bacterium]
MKRLFKIKEGWYASNETLKSERHSIINNAEIDSYMGTRDGQIIIANEKLLYASSEREGRAELLVHTALCTHPEPKRVLVVGGDGSEVAEVVRHGIQPDWLPFDAIQIIETFFPERSTLIDQARCIDAPAQSYDVIIVAELYGHCFDGLANYLSERGLATIKATSSLHEPVAAREELARTAEPFWIAMPFLPATPWARAMGEFYIFCSRHYHPTADLLLQRADFLEGVQVYTPELHVASFTLPRYLVTHFRGIAKN